MKKQKPEAYLYILKCMLLSNSGYNLLLFLNKTLQHPEVQKYLEFIKSLLKVFQNYFQEYNQNDDQKQSPQKRQKDTQ